MIIRNECWLIVLRATIVKGEDPCRWPWELHEVVPWTDDLDTIWVGWTQHSPGTIPVGFRWSPLVGFDAAAVPQKHYRWWARRGDTQAMRQVLRPLHLEALARIVAAMQRGPAEEAGAGYLSPAALAARFAREAGGAGGPIGG